MKKAVILLSGGLDSCTVLAVAKQQNFDCYPISFDYGQRHCAELTAAKKIAAFFKTTTHKIISLQKNIFGSCALTDNAIEVPNYSQASSSNIPITYVPARNTIFLSIALGYAETIGAFDIFIGASQIDYSGYPDCRAPFIKSFEELANLATKEGVNGRKFSIHAPLLNLSKSETIKLGLAHGADYSLTISCYNAHTDTRDPCGKCDSCIYRMKGFIEAGLQDPARTSFA